MMCSISITAELHFFSFRFWSRTATAAAGRSAHCNIVSVFIPLSLDEKKKRNRMKKTRPDLGYCSWTVAHTTGGEKTIKTISLIITFSAGVILTGAPRWGTCPRSYQRTAFGVFMKKKS